MAAKIINGVSTAMAQRYVREVKIANDGGLVAAAKERMLTGKRPILSSNLTCGVSINVSIAHTCKTNARTGEGASPLCAIACYAKAGRSGMRHSVAKAQAVYELFNEQPIQWLADRIYKDYKRHAVRLKGRLRWNGIGDLFPRQVEVLRYMLDHCEDYPLIERHYMYSKRVSLLNTLPAHPRLAAMVSIDQSNTRIAALITRPETGLAWLQSAGDGAIPESVPGKHKQALPVRVIFPEHSQEGQFTIEPRTCPKLVSLAEGGIPKKLACATCTRCSE